MTCTYITLFFRLFLKCESLLQWYKNLASVPQQSTVHHFYFTTVGNCLRIWTVFTMSENSAYIPVAALIIIFNIVEIILILRIKNRTMFDKLLLSLALSDVIVGVVVAIFQGFHQHMMNNTWLKPKVVVNVFLLSMTFSTTNLFAIALDRFLSVQFPIKHRILCTNRRANIFIVALWMVCLVFATASGFITWTLDIRFISNILSVSLLVFGVFIITLYCAVFHLICKRKMRATRTDGKEVVLARASIALFLKGPYKAERSVFFTGCIVTISFIICSYPFAFNLLILQNFKLLFVTQFLIVLNSLFNPFIYFFKKWKG